LRVGTTPVDRGLLYVTGGVATARVEATLSFPGVGTFSETKTRWGWTVGAGAEYAVGAGWSVKADYLFVRLNDSDYFNPSPAAAVAVRSNVPVDDHVFRVGVNYNFGCLLFCGVMAKY
jgi:outer membrane immunogenic protein